MDKMEESYESHRELEEVRESLDYSLFERGISADTHWILDRNVLITIPEKIESMAGEDE